MIEATKEELQSRGFKPLYPENWDETPNYATYGDGKIFIFMEHLKGDRYFVHRALDMDFTGYAHSDFEMPRLEHITTLSQLETFLNNPDQKIVRVLERERSATI